METPTNGSGQPITPEEGGLDWSSMATDALPYMKVAVAVITIGIKVFEIHKLLHAVDVHDKKEGR